jgi:DNA polymerase III epsilon subunit-like protein
MENPYVHFIDLETTGFSPSKNDVIEVAAIIAKKQNDGTLIRVDQFNEFCSPYHEDRWTIGAEKIHRISKRRAFSEQHPRKLLIKYLHFLKEYKDKDNNPLLYVCHSKNFFDYRHHFNMFLKEGLQDSFNKVFSLERYESTINLAEKYISATGLENSKLPTLAEYFNVELDHHNALSDANACFEIYKILKKYKTGLGLFDE